MRDLSYTRSKKALYNELFYSPLKESTAAIVTAFVSLILMSIANVIFLLLVGPFLKALLGGYGSGSKILLSDLIPGDLKFILSSHLPESVDFSLVATYLPIMLVMTASIKSLSSFYFQVNQQIVSLWITKKYRDRLFETLMQLPTERSWKNLQATGCQSS